MLLMLVAWIVALSRIATDLSVYLEQRSYSLWEWDYYRFHSGKSRSARDVAFAFLFLLLGSASLLTPVAMVGLDIVPNSRYVVFSLFLFVLYGAVVVQCFVLPNNYRLEARSRWADHIERESLGREMQRVLAASRGVREPPGQDPGVPGA